MRDGREGAMRVSRLTEADMDVASAILFEAFGAVYRQRGHTPPFPTRDSAAWLCRAYLELDPDGCFQALVGTTTVGVAFAHPRGPATSIGPLAARPGAPAGVARALMAAVGRMASGATSLRLFQDSFNPDSFGLYARLGYAIADVAPYLLAERLTPPSIVPPVRALRPEELPAVHRYDEARTRADRRRDLELLASTGTGLVATDPLEQITGYLFFRPLPARVVIGPGVAESADTMADLVDGVAVALPGRAAVIRASAANPEVLLRAFARGFRVDHLGNLMVSGVYSRPPAQLYALFPESL